MLCLFYTYKPKPRVIDVLYSHPHNSVGQLTELTTCGSGDPVVPRAPSASLRAEVVVSDFPMAFLLVPKPTLLVVDWDSRAK